MWTHVLALGSTLHLKGSESAISFSQTGAKLSATCPVCPQSEKSPPKPRVLKMAPNQMYAPVAETSYVMLRLADVAISCAGVAGNVPW